MIDEGLETQTSYEQKLVEESIIPLLSIKSELFVSKHLKYLRKGLKLLPKHFVTLDASKPWLCYWIFHSNSLMNNVPEQDLVSRAITTLKECMNEDGGFGGGLGQLSHLATTYAAVNTIAILATEEAYKIIDRKKILSFLLSMKQSNGSFSVHENGEIDVRGIYCALSIAKLLSLPMDDLVLNVSSFIKQCQTYEGGIGGVPGAEAHGGYAFCAVAAMEIAECLHELDLKRLGRWALSRQMEIEGGFQGRTNKLVDGCYSFWLSGMFPIIGKYLNRFGLLMRRLIKSLTEYDKVALERYILNCCQGDKGGLKDKPEKSPDFYHTCYCLSGLSITINDYKSECSLFQSESSQNCGLQATDPIFNVSIDKRVKIQQYFSKYPSF